GWSLVVSSWWSWSHAVVARGRHPLRIVAGPERSRAAQKVTDAGRDSVTRCSMTGTAMNRWCHRLACLSADARLPWPAAVPRDARGTSDGGGSHARYGHPVA